MPSVLILLNANTALLEKGQCRAEMALGRSQTLREQLLPRPRSVWARPTGQNGLFLVSGGNQLFI